jgi:hypothetical protein
MMLLAFWQFASGGMLFWALAAAAPLLIHLLTRRRYRQVTWAAMEYLLAAVEKNRRCWQVEHWLLLAVRTLMLLMFALALADPSLSLANRLFFSGNRAPIHHILVLDGSYSMDYRSPGESRFKQAKAFIRKRLEGASLGDGFSLILLADVPRVVIGDPAFEVQDVLEELDNLELTYSPAEALAAMPFVEQVAAAGRKKHAHFTGTQVTWIGDLEKTTWGSLASEEAQRRCKKLSETASIEWVNVNSVEPVSNRAVVSLEVQDAPVTVDREFSMTTTVQQFGVATAEAPLVTLLVDGEVMAQQRAEFSEQGQARISFRHRFAAPGDHAVEVQLPGDALPCDDRRYAIVSVREALKVMCVYGRPGETQFLAAALSPEKTRTARVQVQEASLASLNETELSSFDAVFLANVSQLSLEQTQILANYVQLGGGLVVFPGDLTEPETFWPSGKQVPALLPAQMVSVSVSGEYRFDPLQYRHPLVVPFRGFEKAGLLTAPIWKYVKLDVGENKAAQVPLRFQNGDVAIVEHKFGTGRVMMFAMPASPNALDASQQPPTPWTALPTWPCFPPLVQETLSLVTRERDQAKSLLVHEAIHATLTSASPESSVAMRLPTQENQASPPHRVALLSSGDVWRWSWEETARLGIYEAQYEQLPLVGEKFAVNLDPRESALVSMDAAELPKEFQAAEVSSSTAANSTREAGTTWFRGLLLGVFGLLLLEAWLTARFSGGGA